jgi:nucleoid-associated protein YgaU
MALHKAFPLAGAGALVGAGAAWLSGVMAPYGVPSPLMDPAAIVDAAPEAAKQELSALTQAAETPGAAPAAAQAESAAPVAEAPEVAAPADAPAVPSFDIVRVQPDGSMVLAGRGPAGTAIDIVTGERIIGSTVTDESGAFAFVLDNPLPAGNYEISLVAKTGETILRSLETAVVQVPETPAGEVLAIVTAPDKATEVVSAGTAALVSPATTDEQAAVAATTIPAAPAPAVEAASAADAVAAAAPATANETAAAAVALPAPEAPAAGIPSVEARIAAVEMDGESLMVSGSAAPAATVRIYVGEALVGDAVADAAGNFALMSRFPVAEGAQTIRADVVEPATGAVISRATVPFERAKGEAVAVAAAPGATQQPLEQQAAANTPAIAATQTSVVIRKGDTLWQISRLVYGKGVRFSTIYNANLEQISDPDRIWPGQVFVMPRQTEDGAAADFNALNGQTKETPVSE